MVRLILIGILLGILTACGSLGTVPSNQLVQKALAIQLAQTQQQLNQQLKPVAPIKIEIARFKITSKQPLVGQNLPIYRVQGKSDLTVQLQKRRIKQQQKPFEVYLQRQNEGKTWRLLLPEASSKGNISNWRSYLI